MATNSAIFNKGKYEVSMTSDGRKVTTSNIPFPKRGLVVFNDKNVVYTIDARCRNTDKKSVAKCMVKALLAEELSLKRENSTEAVMQSGNKQSAYVKGILACERVIVTDNECNPIKNATLSVRGVTMNGVFRDIFKFDKKKADGIYKLVVEDGLAWDDSRVIVAMKWFVEAAMQHMSYLVDFDKEQERSSASTKAEQDAADKKAKDAAEKRAAAKAAKEAKEAAAA